MKLTVDSSEPLEDALRVVGALYGVTLVVSEAGPGPSALTSPRATKPRKRSITPKPRTRTAVVDSSSKTSGARRVRPAAAPSSAEVRSWARLTGVTVNSRGGARISDGGLHQRQSIGTLAYRLDRACTHAHHGVARYLPVAQNISQECHLGPAGDVERAP